MKRRFNRAVSFLLAIVMAFSLLPVSAGAAADTTGWTPANTHNLGDVTVTEYYKMVKVDGYNEFRYMLVVQPTNGTGALPNYSNSASVPWARNAQLMSTIYIEDGITSIGNFCFADMPLLETVTIENPSDLTRIGDSAFDNDRKLTISVKSSGSRVLDLPNVTEIGSNAFSNCVALGSGGAMVKFGSALASIGNSAFNSTYIQNIEFAELNDGSSLTIGDSAFAWCGIKSIELPEGLATIGDHAFAYNSLSGSLVIPDSVTDIGRHAFFVSSDSKNRSLTELTLGKKLGRVGESAFQNYIGLKTVNIRTTNTGLTLDSKAFGHDQTDAYWTNREIDGKNYYVGADFKIVDDTISQDDQKKILDAFENGVNCYLGAVSPLQLVDTVDPTCLTDGTNEYQYTLTLGTGNTETKELFEVIPHLEHDWKPAEPSELAPSCEQPGRNLYVCMNAQGVIDPEDPEDVTVTDVATGAKVTVLVSGGHYEVQPIDGQPAAEHHYQPSSAVNETINGDTGSGTTTLTYACTTPGHINADDPSFNSYGNVVTPDHLAEAVNFTVNWKKINVTTTTTLGQVEEQLAGMVSGDAGTLAIVYGNDQNATTTLPAGAYKLALKFIPSDLNRNNYTGMGDSSEFGGQTLKLTGTVNKVALDFTGVFFKDAGTTVSDKLTPVATTIANPKVVPEHETGPVFSYRPENDVNGWQTTPPVRTSAATWVVKAEYTIDTNLYTVTNCTHVSAATGYTLDYEDSTGKVTITAPYIIRPRVMSSITATTANGTYGDGKDTQRLQLSNVPGSSTVYYTVTKDGVQGEEQSVQTTWTDWEETGGMSVGTFTKAGTYQVNIRVENTSGNYSPNKYTLSEQTIIVAKKTIPVPVGKTLTYTPGDSQQGVPDSTDGSYTLSENCSASDAETYQGTVTLTDPDNTKWATTDEASTQVSYTINPRQVAQPTMTSGFGTSYPYSGNAYTAAQLPVSVTFTYSYEDGQLIGKYGEYIAVTVTDAQRTDAGNYSTVATLNNPTGKQNYVWLNTNSSDPIPLVNSWAITRANYTLPSITVGSDNSVEYTGKSLDESIILFNDQNKDSYSLSLVGSDKLTVDGYTWLKNGQAIGSAPTDVGEYQLKVTFRLSDVAKLSNYIFTGDDNHNDEVITTTISVEITKATLTLQAGTAITTSYTGGEIEIPEVTVSGLLPGDQDTTLSYSYTPDGDGSQTQTQNTPFKFTDVGTYVVSVQPTADSNYTGEPVNVTLTITEAGQKVKLTAEEGTTLSGSGTIESPYAVTKELADAAFYVTGAGYVDNGTLDGHATGATVSYSSSKNTVAMVANNGTVTIKGAGKTVITVTAAEDTNKGNYGPGITTYTLTVNKAMPTIDVSGYGGKFETAYDSDPITGYEKAKLTGVSGIAPTGKLVYTFYTDADCNNPVDNGGGTDSNIPIAVGKYYLKVSYAGDDNYNFAESTAIPVQVTKAAIGTVAVTPYDDTYDGQKHFLKDQAVTVEGFTSDQFTVQYIQSATQPDAEAAAWQNDVAVKDVADSTGAVKYWYKVTINGGNYEPAIGEIQVTITPKPLAVSGVPGSFEKEYDGNNTVTTNLNSIKIVTGTSETITVSDATGTYNDKHAGKDKQVTLTLTLTLSGVSEWGNYSYKNEPLTEGKLTLTENTGKITPKPITVTGGITATPRVYDGTTEVKLTGTTLTSSGVLDADKDDVQLTLKANAVGTLADADAKNGKQVTIATSQIQRDGDEAGNYDVTSVTPVTVNIRKATVTLKAPTKATASYTGQPLDTKYYQVAASGLTGNDRVVFDAAKDITYTFQKDGEAAATTTVPSDQGTYTVTAKLAATAANKYKNYDVQQVTFTVTISASALTETTKDYSAPYDGKDHELTDLITSVTGVGSADVSGYTVVFVKSDSAPSDWTTGVRTSVKDVADSGTYWYKISADNYTDKTGSVKVDISRLELTVTPILSTNTKVYDGTTDFQTANITSTDVTGEATGETITATAVSAAYNSKDVAGANTITIRYTLSGDDLVNYTYGETQLGNGTDTVSVEVPGTITAKPVTVTIENQNAVYDGAPAELEKDAWDFTGDEFYRSDAVTITLSASGAQDAGTHTINGTVSGGDKDNYTVSFVTGTLTIAERPVTLQIGDASGYYGDAPVKPGNLLTDVSDKSADPDTGLVGTNKAADFLHLVTVNADAASEVGGSYTITGKDGKSGNYHVTFQSGAYTVNKRPVTVTIADKSSLYGQGTVDLTSSTSNMANGESLDVELGTDATQSSNVDTYAIYVVAMDQTVAANYDVTVEGETEFGGDSTRATYTIGRANLSAAFDSKVLYPNFGRPVTNPVTFSNASVNPYAEVVDQDDLADIAAAAHYTSDNPSAVSVNENTGAVTLISANASATISLTVDETQNFNAITVPVTYTINVGSAGGYQPNFTPGNLTYNGQHQQLMTLNGTLPAGLSIQYSTDNANWEDDLTQITGIDAGNYTVYWKITDSSGNYGDSNGTVFVTIAKDILEDEEGFTHKSPSIVFSQYQNKTYENPLQLPGDYHGTVTFQGSNDTVATIDADGKVTVKQNGTVTITATCYTDDNYQGRQYSYTLTVASSGIDYTAPAALNSTYNGEEQDSLTTPVTSTTPGAVIRYGVNTGGLSFPDDDVPKIKDAGTYEIWYQVTAPGGYATVVDHVTAVIHPKDITEGMISGISDSYTYSGNKITPIPTVTDQELSQRLTANVDYTLSYGENTQVGTGTVTIAGTGNYGDFIQRTFKIEAVGGEEITASLSEYFGSLDQYPGGTTTEVSVTHGNHDVGFTITDVTPTAQVDADGKTISFTDPGVYTITVKAGDTLHAEQEFTLTYMLMPKTSDGGFALTFDGNDTRVVTYGQRLIPDGQTAADLLEVKDGNGVTLTYSTDYTLSCMYYDCLGSSGQPVTTVQGIPAAGMYVVTAAGTGQYGSDQTGVFTLLVLQKSIGSSDIAWTVADDALEYNAGAQEPTVTSGTFTDEAGGTQSVDFAVDSYQNNTNAGSDTARAIVKAPAGSNNYTGTAGIPFSIARRPIVDDAGKFTITVPASVNISVGGEARPAATIYDLELGRELTSQDFTVTYANNTSAGTATVSITGTGNYHGSVERTFTVVVTSTSFEMEITPAVWEYQSASKPTAITVTNNGTPLDIGTDYTLSISKDGGGEQSFTNTAEALAYLDKPGTYTVKATGIGGYSFTETQTVTIKKAKLALSITVDPAVKAGGGTVQIQVTPGTWPAGIDGTKFTKLTVTKGGTAQNDLTLEYDGAAGAYKEVTFSFGNDTAVYTFGVDTVEITGFDPDCYELAITGGTLSVVQQTGGGGGGGGAITPPAEDPDDGIADPDETGVSDWLITGEHIQYLSGYGESLFGPTDNMTRAQAAQMFYNLLKDKDVPVTVSFTDVLADTWYAEPVGVLASLGILNGVGEGLYEPDRAITRAEFTAIAMRFARVDTSGADIFPDVHADDWFYEVVVSAVTYGWINGYADGTFRPDKTITRAEVAAIVNRMLGRSADKAYVDTHADELTQFTDVSPYYWAYYDIMEAANAHDHTNQGGVETWQD